MNLLRKMVFAWPIFSYFAALNGISANKSPDP